MITSPALLPTSHPGTRQWHTFFLLLLSFCNSTRTWLGDVYNLKSLLFIIIITYPLTTRVAGAPQMISQPVSSIFFHARSITRTTRQSGETKVCKLCGIVCHKLHSLATIRAPTNKKNRTWWSGLLLLESADTRRILLVQNSH